ncbi:MAG: GAF domain-containing protein, partial [Thermoflexales bacterium]|nr:GAF domain-containing protein [Thermoflexales bacterium]
MARKDQTRRNRIFGRLSTRLLGPFALGALISVGIVSLMLFFSVKTQTEQTVFAQREVAQRLAAQAGSYLTKLQNDVRTVANVVVLSASTEKALPRILENIQQAEPGLLELVVLDAAGAEQARVARPDVELASTPRASTPAFTLAISGQSYLGPVRALNNFPVVMLAEPILTQDGEIVGVASALVDLTVLGERIADSNVGQRGYAFIVDDHGTLVAYRDLRAVPPNLMMLYLPVVSDAIAAKAESGTTRTYDTSLVAPAESTLAYFTPLPLGRTNWYVIVEQPVADALAQVNNFTVAGLGLMFASIVSTVIMGFFISRRIAVPIDKLRKGAAQLAAGDLTQRIVGVQTGDELESLATEFNEMAHKLQDAQGNLAAVARERELQYQTAQRRVKEMSTLLEAGRAITSLDLENVLGNLARESAGTVGADRCAIFVANDSTRQLELRGWWDFEGVPQPVLAYELGEGLVGWVAHENRSLFLANAQSDQRFVGKWAHDADVAAVMNLPLVIDADVVGVLQVSTRPGTPAFSREDQRLLTSFADQSAAAIKNSQLYEVERRRAQDMTVVAEINRAISASLDLDNTLNSILKSIQSVIPYDRAEINLWYQADGRLHTRGFGGEALQEQSPDRTSGVYQLGEGYTGWIAQQRQPLLVADVANSPIKPVLSIDHSPIKSVCGVPLLSGDDLVGTLELASFSTGAFTAVNIETLGTIAAQSAVAIQNAQLFAETRRRVNESAELLRVSTIAASALTPDEVLRQLMTEIGKFLRADLGLALVYDSNTRFLEPLTLASFGELPDAVEDFRIDTTLANFQRSVFKTRLVFRTDDALRDRRILGLYRPFIDRYRVRALLTAPLVLRDEAIGEIYMAKRTTEAFSAEDEQRLTTVLPFLADAIVNARLTVDRERRLKQLSLLGEVGREISSALNEQAILELLYPQINRIISAHTLFIALYDEEHDELHFARLYENDQLLELPPDERTQRGGNSLTFYVCRTRQMLMLHGDIGGQARERGIEVRTVGSDNPAKVWLGVPMIAGDRVLGVLVAQDLNDEYAYDQNDLNMLQAIANQTGIALSNARLYQVADLRLGERVEELTALSSISQELNATLERERIFEVVLTEALKVTGATHGFISLINAETQELETRASQGYSAEYVKRLQAETVPVGSGITGRAVRSGAPLVVGDVRTYPDYMDLLPQTRSEIAVPIRYAQSVVGALNLESPEIDAFSDEHVRFLEALASQAAIAIGNALRLEDQLERGELLRRKAEQLTNLFQIGQAFRTDQPLDLILDDVVHAIQETVGFNLVSLSLLEGEPPHLQRVAAAGIPIAVFEEMRRVAQPWSAMAEALQDRFRMSQSYYVPMEHRQATDALHTYTSPATDQSEVRTPGQWHADDMLVSPLRGSGDRVLGILSVDEPLGGKIPDRATIETLELFANQAAIAVENSRLYADLQQRLDNLTLFNEVGRSIGAKLDLDSLMVTVLDASIELVNSQHATIFLRDPVDGKFVPRKAVGFDLDMMTRLRFGPNEGLIGAVIADPRGLIVPDVLTEARFVEHPISNDVRSMLLVPLSAAGQLIGVLSVDKLVPNGFTNTDLVVLSTLADQAAVAIENARLFEESQRRLQDQSLLYEAGQAISATLEYRQVLETVTHQVERATNAQFVIIQEWERPGNRLVTIHANFISTEGLNTTTIRETAFAPMDYLKVAHFLRDRRNISLRLNDDDLDPMLRERMRQAGLLWTIEVPIVARDEVLGLLRLGDGRFDRVLGDSEVQLVETLVNQAAVAMSNARLYDQVIKFTQELEGRVEARTHELAQANTNLTLERDRVEVLFRITSELSSSLDLDRVLNRALELVVRAVGAAHGSITLVDQQTDMLILRAVLGAGGSLPPGGRLTLFRRDEGLSGWAVTNRQAVIVPDLNVDARWVAMGDNVRHFRSALVSPLQMGEDVLGAMMMLHTDTDYFNDKHMKLVAAAANQVATAINNAELYRYIREQAELLGGMLRGQQIESSKSQAILESIADGVMVSDSTGRVIMFNAASEGILGISREAALGRSIEDMQGLYSAAGVNWVNQVREWHASSDARRRTPVLSQRIEFTGERRFVNVSIAPVTMSDEYLGSVSVFRDITREVEADRTKSEFVSTVSHELRTPMTSIKGYADLLLMGAAGQVNDTQQRFLSVIKSNADRLS